MVEILTTTNPAAVADHFPLWVLREKAAQRRLA